MQISISLSIFCSEVLTKNKFYSPGQLYKSAFFLEVSPNEIYALNWWVSSLFDD